MIHTILAASLFFGTTYSSGLGEHSFAPLAELRADSGGWRVSGDGELSRKLESDAGYILGAEVERYLGPVILSVRGRYRDGGDWIKRGIWPGIGIGSRNRSLILRHEIRTARDRNDTWSLSATLGTRRLEWRSAVYNYRVTFGTVRQYGITQTIGIKLKDKNQ